MNPDPGIRPGGRVPTLAPTFVRFRDDGVLERALLQPLPPLDAQPQRRRSSWRRSPAAQNALIRAAVH
jgi:hypothetical protein